MASMPTDKGISKHTLTFPVLLSGIPHFEKVETVLDDNKPTKYLKLSG